MAERNPFGLEKASAIGADPYPLRGLSLPDLLSRVLSLGDRPSPLDLDEATGEAGGRVPPRPPWAGAEHIGADPAFNVDFGNEALSMAPRGPIGWLGKLLGKAGERIPEPQQTGVSAEHKIPRFRSPQGTFVKHEGEWWRLEPQPPLDPNITLSKLDKVTGQVLQQKRISVEEMIESAQKSNAFNNTR